MLRYLKYNLIIMSQKKTFRFVFFGMVILCVSLPLFQLMKHWGEYEYALPSADVLFVANGESEWWSYLSFLFPFLIILPYGFSFMDEHKNGVILYVLTRGERRTYYYAQMATCFIGTAITILIPFLLNILMNGILFPMTGNDAVMGYQKYDVNWCMRIMGQGFYKNTLSEGAILKHLAIDLPQVRNILISLWTAIVSGVISCFFYGVSLLVKRGSIWILIISYLFFQFFVMLDNLWEEAEFFGMYVNLDLLDYLSGGYPEYGLIYPLYLLILLVLLALTCGMIQHRVRNDER